MSVEREERKVKYSHIKKYIYVIITVILTHTVNTLCITTDT